MLIIEETQNYLLFKNACIPQIILGIAYSLWILCLVFKVNFPFD